MVEDDIWSGGKIFASDWSNATDEIMKAVIDNGTLAKNISLAQYLPLIGGTLTGGLNLIYASTPTIATVDTTNTVSLVQQSSDTVGAIYTQTSHNVLLGSNNSFHIVLDADNITKFRSNVEFEADTNIRDDVMHFFGTGNDFEIYYRTTDSDNELRFDALTDGTLTKSFTFNGASSSTGHGTDWNANLGSGSSGQSGGDFRWNAGSSDSGQGGIVFFNPGTSTTGTDGYIEFGTGKDSVVRLRDASTTLQSTSSGTLALNATDTLQITTPSINTSGNLTVGGSLIIDPNYNATHWRIGKG